MSWGMAMCPCGAPLISTMAFPKAEFYCLECGRLLGFLSPIPAEETPELRACYDALKAEWDEHAGRKLITPRSWHKDCAQCELGDDAKTHDKHVTAEEVEADRIARAWLLERAGQEATA